MILVVNIKNNSVFEIDEVAMAYINYAQMHDGEICEELFAEKNNMSIEIVSSEIKCLTEMLGM